MPAALKDVSSYLVKARVLAPMTYMFSKKLYCHRQRRCASDTEPGDEARLEYGDVT